MNTSNPNESFNNLQKSLDALSRDLPKQLNGALDIMKPFLTEAKKYPVVINDKRGVLSVFKNNAISLELEGATDTDIKHILRCLDDRHTKS
jgi:hypothetical protein